MSALRTASFVRYNATGKTALRFTNTATGGTCCEASNPTNPILCDVCAAEFSRLRAEVSAARSRHERLHRVREADLVNASDDPDAPPSLEAALLAAKSDQSADVVNKRIRSFFLGGQ